MNGLFLHEPFLGKEENVSFVLINKKKRVQEKRHFIYKLFELD